MGVSREVRRPVDVSRQRDPWPEGHPLGASVTYPTGTMLHRQGEPVGSVYLIDRGILKMIRSEANGRELITAFRGPGWFLGAAAVILGGPAELTAQCACECDVRALGANEFRRIHATEASVAAWVQRMLAREVREQATRMGQFLLKPGARLDAVLHALAQSAPESRSGHLPFPIHQHEIGDAIGTSRETVTRLLAGFEQVGKIRRQGGWITHMPKRGTGSGSR